MSKNLYEILALMARYLFAGLMVLIVARAWRITLVDSRRAKTLRRVSPETGIVGELMVLEGSEKARRGMKYKVIREGMIGSARRADIRIRHSSVRRRHAYFLLTDEGLKIRAHAGAPLKNAQGRSAGTMILQDGDTLDVGRVQLMLILSDAPQRAYGFGDRFRPGRGIERADDDFDAADDDLFETHGDVGGEDWFDVIAPESSRTPVRRHLPFEIEPPSNLNRSPVGRTVDHRPATPRTQPGIRRNRDIFSDPSDPMADNPLNSRRSQHRPMNDSANDDEMW